MSTFRHSEAPADREARFAFEEGGGTSAIYEAAKRVLDLIVATTVILLLTPVLLAIFVITRTTSPGPALFRQPRVGRHECLFTLIKFRSMHTNSEDELHRAYITHLMTVPAPTPRTAGLYKLTDDPRVTRFGGFLRRTSLDELPQLFNVIRGEMSLVGPRPALAYELPHYHPSHRSRFSVKPGLTGLWQVSGRNALTMREALDLDVEYVQHRNLLLDLRILARTIPTVLRGLGAR